MILQSKENKNVKPDRLVLEILAPLGLGELYGMERKTVNKIKEK